MIEVYSQNIKGTWFSIATKQQKIIASTFASTQQMVLNNILSNIPFNQPFQVFHEPSTFAKTTFATLKDIYDGKDIDPNLPLETDNLPVYTKEVLRATLAIPVGYVTSYGAIAKTVGGGARAVGNAMACNRFAPIVPCHRVVKSDLSLGGYGAGGLRVKLEFLGREKRGYTEPKEIDVGCSQLRVFPVEYVLRKFT